jgi:two-component sensor histidine kinase
VQPLFNGDTRLFYVESWQRRKDGRKRLLAWWCKALIDSQGKSIGALSTARDITEIQQAEEKLKTALEEKTVLLREVHHRVKNNLQAIISLMHMRAARISDLEVQQFLIELEQQARSMLLVYEQVYQSENLAQVQMQPYLDLLTTHIIQAFGLDRSIRLQVNAQDVLLNIDQAMPCGLIINELVTNALKHAFPPEFREPPSLYVAMRHAGSEYVLTVADNGIGLPAGFDWSTLQSMGLQLVRMWVEHQMGGTFRVDAAEGTAYTITFSHGDS